MNAALDTAVRITFAILFNSLWEGILIALAAAAILRFRPQLNATTRSTVLTVALAAAIVLPIATTFAALASYAPRPTATSTTAVHGSSRTAHIPPIHLRPIRSTAAQPVRLPQTSNEAPKFVFERLHLALPRAAVLGVVAFWALAALFAIVRLSVSLMHLERLKHDALPLAIEYRTRMDRWMRAAKGGRGVRLCRSPEITIPIAVGLFDAMILVPETLIDELSPEDVDRILLHELAHLRRGDDWINAVERIAQAVFFFSPGILWIVGRLDLEREVVCDDWVLDQTAEIRQYATCLARVAEITAWPYRAMAAPGAFITRRSMSIRIERLLEAGRDVRIHTSVAPAGLAVAAAIALCIVAAFVSPSFAYTTSPMPQANGQRDHRKQQSEVAATHAVEPKSARTAAVPPVQPAALPSAAPAKAPAATATPAVIAAHTTLPESQLKAATRVSVKHEVTLATPSYTLAQNSNTSTVAQPISKPVSSQTIAEASSGDYIDDLAAAGYRNLSLDELIRLKSLGINGQYIRDLEAAGLAHPSVDDLVRLAGVGVNGDFVRQMRRLFPSISASELSNLKAVGVNGAYIDELRTDGFTNLSVDDVQSMRAVGVDAQYIHQMRSLFGNLSANQLRSMRAVGVTPDYIMGLRSYGLNNIGADEATSLRAIGVDPEYIRQLRDAGYPNLSKDDIERCRAMGIDAAFIRNAAAHGFHNLSIDQLIRLKASGIL